MGRLRPLGLHALRPRGRAPARRRPRQVDRRGPRATRRDAADAGAVEYPVVERDDATIRAFKDDVLAHFGNPLIDVRSPRSTPASAPPLPGLPRGGRAARRPHPERAERAVGAGRRRRRHLHAARRARRDLPRGRGPRRRRRRHRLLPHRRALEPHLVRAHPPARLRERAQLRRLVDRVGQRRARADRHRAPSPARRRRRAAPWHDESRDHDCPAPDQLAEIRDDFLALEAARPAAAAARVLERAARAARALRDHPDLLERVEECQSPVFIFVEVDDGRCRAPVRDRPARGADHARLRVDPRAGPRRADRRRGARRSRRLPADDRPRPRRSRRCASAA